MNARVFSDLDLVKLFKFKVTASPGFCNLFFDKTKCKSFVPEKLSVWQEVQEFIEGIYKMCTQDGVKAPSQKRDKMTIGL